MAMVVQCGRLDEMTKSQREYGWDELTLISGRLFISGLDADELVRPIVVPDEDVAY